LVPTPSLETLTTFVRFSESAENRILACVEVHGMRRYEAYDFDNRNSEQMYNYLEARIDAMKRRISDLELENAKLRCEIDDSRYALIPA
jgi:hypothetical protein